MKSMRNQLVLSPHSVLRVLLATIVALTMIHVALSFGLKYGFGRDNVFGLTGLFDLLGERNAPTMFSTMLIVFCAVLLLAAGSVAHRHRPQWLGLSVLFVLLALDETAGFHEMLAHRLAPEVGDNRQFAWALPYVAAALLIALVYLPFLKALPARYRWWFIGAGALYVAAAAGLEILAGFFNRAGLDLYVQIAGTFEESLEMVAMALFAYAVLDFLANLPEGPLSVTVRGADARRPTRQPEPVAGESPMPGA